MPSEPNTYSDSNKAQAEQSSRDHTFEIKRARLLCALETPGANIDFLRRELDDLYINRRLELDRASDDLNNRSTTNGTEAASISELRTLIRAMMEDGLLRYSRRQRLLEEARNRGIVEFHAQLLIAQVQIGNDAPFLYTPSTRRGVGNDSRVVRVTTMSLIAIATVLVVSLQLH